MSHLKTLGYLLIASWIFLGVSGYAEQPENIGQQDQATPTANKVVKPYRTFLQIQRYTIENNGEPESPISNVKLEIKFPNQSKIDLPGGGQYWPIGNGQIQEIEQIFEVPWEFVKNDGFAFDIQIVRKGVIILPCKFEVVQLSQFNRSYVCRLDTDWQLKQNVSQDKLDKEAVQIRIFTDLNSPSKEIPKDVIALK